VDGMKAENGRRVNDRGPAYLIASVARDLLRGHRTRVRRSLAPLGMKYADGTAAQGLSLIADS
jgi:hypothetical protein